MIKAIKYNISKTLIQLLRTSCEQDYIKKKHLITTLLLLLTLLTSALYAQVFDKTSYNWYWGQHAAMTFNTPDLEPEMLNTSMLNVASGGSGVISDKNGVLQFYTDGINVWNRQDQVMAGAPLCTTLYTTAPQQAIVVPQPEDNKDRFYYIFHWGFRDESVFYDDTLFVSRVDMAGAGGLGEVIEKRRVVYPNCYTRFCAVRHANNRDAWLITHSNSGDAYYAFLITKEGVSTTPVVSHCGYNYPYPIIATWREFMQISPDGRTVMQPVCLGNSNVFPPYSVDLLSFNNSSGHLNYITISQIFLQMQVFMEEVSPQTLNSCILVKSMVIVESYSMTLHSPLIKLKIVRLRFFKIYQFKDLDKPRLLLMESSIGDHNPFIYQ